MVNPGLEVRPSSGVQWHCIPLDLTSQSQFTSANQHLWRLENKDTSSWATIYRIIKNQLTLPNLCNFPPPPHHHQHQTQSSAFSLNSLSVYCTLQLNFVSILLVLSLIIYFRWCFINRILPPQKNLQMWDLKSETANQSVHILQYIKALVLSGLG
jgi:hypothetical protein